MQRRYISKLFRIMQKYATLCKRILLIEHNLYPEYSFSITIRILNFFEENIQYLMFDNANARTLLVTRFFGGFFS